jgi:nucleoside 2-deoxyribosyltransferase
MSNRELIESISSHLERQGISVTCMVRDFEQWGARQYTPSELMRITFQQIDASDIVIIEFSDSGIGRSIEAGYAFAKGKPIIVIAKPDAVIPKTIEGVASAIQRYTTVEDISVEKMKWKV